MVQNSADGITWQDIMKVSGAGNSFILKNYTATDNNPNEGVSYYRLKQTDKDGRYTFSQIRTINNVSNHQTLSIYPNPATEKIYIRINTAGKMKLFDILGKNVANAVLEVGTNQINIESFSKGSYIMIIETPKDITRYKVLKN